MNIISRYVKDTTSELDEAEKKTNQISEGLKIFNLQTIWRQSDNFVLH